MKSAIALLLFLIFLPAGCAPRQPGPAPEGLRIVSLAPNLTEIVCALGAGSALVGRTSVCDYPPEIVRAVPVIGGFGAPSLDRLLKTRPTLVLDVALEDEAVAKLMAQMGVHRVRVPCTRLDDIPAAVLTIGRLAQRESAALALAERIRREVAERRAALEKRRASGLTPPSVFVEIWGDPLMTVGGNSFVSELVALAGGKNLGDEVTGKDYFPVSSEWVIARNPDIILCLYMAAGSGGTWSVERKALSDEYMANAELRTTNEVPPPSAASEATGKQRALPLHAPRSTLHALAGRTGWDRIKAVREGRVYGGFDNNLMLRPGPRVLEGIAALQACIQKTGTGGQ